MHKTQSVFPIVGMRKVSQLQSNMVALSISLNAEQMKRIEAAGGPFSVGVPHDIVVCFSLDRHSPYVRR